MLDEEKWEKDQEEPWPLKVKELEPPNYFDIIVTAAKLNAGTISDLLCDTGANDTISLSLTSLTYTLNIMIILILQRKYA